MALKTKSPKLTGAEIKVRRATAESNAAYGAPEKTLIGGKTTEVLMEQTYDYLLIGELDMAKALVQALWKRERAHRLTFHPDA